MRAKSPERWWTLREIAEDLALPLDSIYSMRATGSGPRGHKIGKHVRVRTEDYESWLATRSEGFK
jgi:predicted DNA-binding transcriptional regulator AlpA